MRVLSVLCIALSITYIQCGVGRLPWDVRGVIGGFGSGDYTAPPNPCDVDNGESLACWTCMNAASDAECQATGEFQECQMEDPVCELEVHENKNGGVYQVTRMCKQRTACENRADNWQVCGELDHNELCRTCGSEDGEGVDWVCLGAATTEAPATTAPPPTCKPPEFPCDGSRKEVLACWTCSAESHEGCQETGQLQVCDMQDPVCALTQERDGAGVVTYVTQGCKQRLHCERLANSPSGMCSSDPDQNNCRECHYGTDDYPSTCVYIPYCPDTKPPEFPICMMEESEETKTGSSANILQCVSYKYTFLAYIILHNLWK